MFPSLRQVFVQKDRLPDLHIIWWGDFSFYHISAASTWKHIVYPASVTLPGNVSFVPDQKQGMMVVEPEQMGSRMMTAAYESACPAQSVSSLEDAHW